LDGVNDVFALMESDAARLLRLELPRTVVLLAAVGMVAITGTDDLRPPGGGLGKVVPELLREHPPTEPGAWRRLTDRVVENSGWHRSFPTTTEMQPVVKPPPDPGWDLPTRLGR
jgi:hypothetical protein